MSNISPQSPRQNHILAALPVDEYERLEDDLELVTLSLGQIIYEAGDNPEFVYFPTTCIVSLIFATEDGSTAELAMTGNNGFLGVSLALGGASTTHEMVVQSSGEAYRLRAEKMARELDQSGSLQRICLCYAQALMTQMAQSVVCNRHHTVEQQLCRWLLVCFDQLPTNQLKMTQELIANMLGVRREAVTESAVKLQASGLIQYRRGQIAITDRPGLEARVCECYHVVKSEYNRLFSQLVAAHTPDRARPKPEGQRPYAETCFLLTDPKKPKATHEADKTLQELLAQQTELEKQNEQLQRAYAEAEALRSRYADIYDFAPVGHFTLDAKGGIIDMNLAGAILLGIKRSENKRHRFSSHLKTRCLPAFNRFVEEVLHTNKKRTCETVLAKTAQRLETRVRIEAIPDESGQECRIVVIELSVENVAEIPRSDRELHQRALLDNSPFMAWLKDEDGRFLAVNGPFASNFGLSSTEAVLGKTPAELVTDETIAPAWLDDSQIRRSGKKQDLVTPVENQGKQRWFESSQSPIVLDGKCAATVGFAREITDRQDAYLALAASEKRCRTLVDNLPLCVAITQRGILKYINAKGADLIGYTAEECIGQPLLQLIDEQDRAGMNECFLQPRQNGTAATDYAVRLVSQKGAVIECLLNASTVEWDGEVAVMGVFEDVTQRKILEAELRSLATIDSLTDLANRRYFLTRQEEALSRQKRGIDQEIAVLMLDLDHFKNINDAFGHLAGDEVLRSFSSVLRNELRQIDIAGRMGGEEFAVMLPETDLPAAIVFAERLRQKVAGTSILLDQQPVSITVSIGIAVMSAGDTRPDQVLQRADEALYRAKTLGRNRIELADATNSPGNIVSPELTKDKFPKWPEDSEPYRLSNIYQTRRFRFDNRQNRPS